MGENKLIYYPTFTVQFYFMESDKKPFPSFLIFPLLFLLLLWIVKLVEVHWKLDFSEFGVYPLALKGIPGILLSPLIHADFPHLISNSLPVLLLTIALFYFYREIAYIVFSFLYVLPGLWVWFSARPSYHIGASGLVYGLVSFLFFSGLVRWNKNLMALTLLIAFLYGSLVWGIFPELFPGKNIWFESHFWGGVAGFIIAIYYRKRGPQKEQYHWDEEEEDVSVDEKNSDEIFPPSNINHT
jgi:membrane associated rhomboid family serine protease